jgi:rhamnogalacturonyl hydrolase YesR
MRFLPSVALLLIAAAVLPAEAVAGKITVTATHDLDIARPAETIVVPWQKIAAALPGALPDHLLVRDAKGQPTPSQFTNFHPEARPAVYDALLFQHDFAAGERRAAFTIETTAEPTPPYPSKVFARHVPERLDDFAWENDRLAHRIYGPGLDTPAAGKSRMISSGIDVWCKRVPYLIVDRWYLRGHDAYHKDDGEGLDLYGVNESRGCGGSGIWDGKALHVSHNWKTWKVLANGPVRAVFELGYEPWDAGGAQVSETKRFTVDAGLNLEQVESTFVFDKPDGEITVAVGIGKHAKVESAEWSQNEAGGWLSLWEKYGKDGQLGTAVMLSPDALTGFAEDKLNRLALTKARSGQAIRYYIGVGWDRSGHFESKADWEGYLAAFAKRLRSPVKVEIASETNSAAKAETPLQFSVRMADSQIARLGDKLAYKPDGKWDYAANVFALSLLKLADETKTPSYIEFVKTSIGSWVTPEGELQGFDAGDYNIDNINGGKVLLELFQRTGEERYRKATDALRAQLRTHPRTSEGGFWHKQRYTSQMWLDGLYMGAPFYAAYARSFGEKEAFDDIAKQFRIIASHVYDPKTGLFYHGWDEAKAQNWANKETGNSANFWSRGIGWFAMALVDTLDFFPPDHPARPELVALLNKVAAGVVKHQDAESGLWRQVTDQGSRQGNYLEATASSMFVYALAKGVNAGHLPPEFAGAARKGYAGLTRDLVKTDAEGRLSLTQCCKVAGLGQPDKRDGSFDYYISEPIVENDFKGVGPFILAGIEMEKLPTKQAPNAAKPAPSMGWENVPEILARIVPPKFADRDFTITDFGAVADGKTDSTTAIAKAIAACHAAGGGRVVVPKGEFLTGAIHLKSNVNLHVSEGATLRFNPDPARYLPVVFTRWEGIECMNYSPLIYAFEQENVAVTGKGTLDGQATDLCDNVTVRGVIVSSHGPNNDGCDPESCRDVLIEDCVFDTGDDCIAIKSGRNADGRRVAAPSENLIVRRCVMKDGHGGVTIGSEISGDCRNVFIEDCKMDSPELDRALRIKTNAMRGGVIENVFMRNVQIGRVAEAVLAIDFNYEEGHKGNFLPTVRHIVVENVVSQSSKHALKLGGFEDAPIRDVRIVNCTFSGIEKDDVIENVVGLVEVNVKKETKAGKAPTVAPKEAQPLRP